MLEGDIYLNSHIKKMNFEQNKLNPIFGRAQIIIEQFYKKFQETNNIDKNVVFSHFFFDALILRF